MRDPANPREIVVPGDMRPARKVAAPVARKRTPSRTSAAPPGEFRAAFMGAMRGVAAICVHRPGETAGSVVALGAVIYVSLNALGFQVGRHPAPILPQANPVADRAVVKAPAIPVAAQASNEKPVPAAQREAPHAAAHDPIADMLRSAGETTASVSPKPDRDVMRAQRALSKLGYGSLKDDGVMGAGTRAALEKFERERKLPVTGRASGRTLRELAMRAEVKKG